MERRRILETIIVALELAGVALVTAAAWAAFGAPAGQAVLGVSFLTAAYALSRSPQ